MSESNGKELMVKVPQDALEFELVIRHNALTGAFELQGAGKNRLVAMAMLDYAKTKLLRIDAQIEMQELMQRAPRIATPGPRIV